MIFGEAFLKLPDGPGEEINNPIYSGQIVRKPTRVPNIEDVASILWVLASLKH